MGKIWPRMAVVSAFCVVLTLLSTSPPAAAVDVGDCGDVTLIFARGSGQDPGETEATKYFEMLNSRMAGLDVTQYELGEREQEGSSYEAIGVEDWVGWSGVNAQAYVDSVLEGVTEFESYLRRRAERCPDEVFTVGGYSQGAQVVGLALGFVDEGLRDRIAHVALFGDPRLHLPEGEAIFPDVCRGAGAFSEWRRGSVSCFTDNGILGSRQPYLPSDIASRAGSWCDREDPICNGNIADFIGSAHGSYADTGAEMDEASNEIALRIRDALPPGDGDQVDVVIVRPPAGSDGLNVAFVIDSTGSMEGEIAAAKAVAEEVGTRVVEVEGRVALTEYRDAGDAFVAEIRSPLTNNIDAFQSALAPLVADGGGDEPEALLAALMMTFDELEWTPGATKAAIVLTDAGYHDPDRVTGVTTEEVARRSLEIDPVNIYPILPAGGAGGALFEQYETLAEATAGQIIVDDGDTASAILAAFEEVTSRPVVSLAFDQYFSRPGETVTLVADAYDVDGEITSFEWDFDGDGVVDEVGVSNVATTTYESEFDGLIEIRVRSNDGGIGSYSARINVSSNAGQLQPPTAPEAASAEPVFDDPGSFQVSWTDSQPSTADKWFEIFDTDGILRGRTQGTTVLISDLPGGSPHVALTAVNEYGRSEEILVPIPDDEPNSPCAVLTPTILGTEGPDRIIGTEGDDIIFALGGIDKVYGKGGNDIICGGEGDDTIAGGEGNDQLFGDAGSDRLFGQSGADQLHGGEGNDALYGWTGNDALEGGVDNDRLFGHKGDDQLAGGVGDDQLYGHDGLDILEGGEGNDRLLGGNQNDTLSGEAGNDTLNGEKGDDSLSGGDDTDSCQGGAGNDTEDGTCERVRNIG